MMALEVTEKKVSQLEAILKQDHAAWMYEKQHDEVLFERLNLEHEWV